MLVSELGDSCANLRTQAETTPGTRQQSYYDPSRCESRFESVASQSPLRFKHSQSEKRKNFYHNLPQSNTANSATSHSLLPKANGERLSYALGGGNYLLLEEVDKGAAVNTNVNDLTPVKAIDRHN